MDGINWLNNDKKEKLHVMLCCIWHPQCQCECVFLSNNCVSKDYKCFCTNIFLDKIFTISSIIMGKLLLCYILCGHMKQSRNNPFLFIFIHLQQSGMTEISVIAPNLGQLQISILGQ